MVGVSDPDSVRRMLHDGPPQDEVASLFRRVIDIGCVVLLVVLAVTHTHVYALDLILSVLGFAPAPHEMPPPHSALSGALELARLMFWLCIVLGAVQVTLRVVWVVAVLSVHVAIIRLRR